MRRPAHGATTRPGPCRPASGYGRELGRPGRGCRSSRAAPIEPSRCPTSTPDAGRRSRAPPSPLDRGELRYSVIADSASASRGAPGPVPDRLRRHQLGEVALELDLALHERLHPGLRVAAT